MITAFIVGNCILLSLTFLPLALGLRQSKQSIGLPLAVALVAFLLTVAVPLSDRIPAQAASEVKGYSTFDQFYQERYVVEHQVPSDRIVHVAIFVTMAICMARKGELLLCWAVPLFVGGLLTRCVQY